MSVLIINLKILPMWKNTDEKVNNSILKVDSPNLLNELQILLYLKTVSYETQTAIWTYH